jgi:hypothetical protein
MGEWMYRSTFSWTRHQLEVSGQLHAPAALSPGKEPPVPIGQEAGWAPRAGLDDVEKRKFLTLPGLELRPVASHYTYCAIPAPRYYDVRN